MSWRVEFDRSAAKALRNLPADVQTRLLKALAELASDPAAARSVKALVGREGFRLRVGDYRVLYVLEGDGGVIRVTDVGHRSSIYS